MTYDPKNYAAPDAPATDGVAVTPSDTVDVAGGPFRCLYVGVSGNIVLITLGGSTLTFIGVPTGILPVRGTRVKNTGTTASSIVALW